MELAVRAITGNTKSETLHLKRMPCGRKSVTQRDTSNEWCSGGRQDWLARLGNVLPG
jgi:hypothetical protein